MIFLQLLSCDYGLDSEYYFKDTAETTQESENDEMCSFCITGVQPNLGPLNGGTTITVTGEGFDNSMTVYFGNGSIAFSVFSENELVFQTPSSLVVGTIDISIEKGFDTHTFYDAFTYYEEGGATTGCTTGGTTTGGGTNTGGNTGGTTGGSNAGMLTGLVEMAVQYYTIPELSPDGNNPMITASFINHQGTSGSWQTWIPPVGGCQNHTALSIPHLVNGTSVGSSVTFTSTQSSFILPSTIDEHGGTTYTSPLNIYQIGANHSYSIELPTGETIPGAISLPSDFISFVPIEPFTSTNIFSTPISVNNFSLQWTANTPPAEILVILEYFSYPDMIPAGVTVCSAQDIGSLFIPSSIIGSYVNYNIVLQLYRMRRGSIYRTDGSYVETLSLNGWTGTAYISQ